MTSPGSSSKDDFLLLLLEALAEPIGLLVTTNDRERARQRFYSARRENVASHPELEGLQIRVSPFEDGELIIVHSIIKPRNAGLTEEGPSLS